MPPQKPIVHDTLEVPAEQEQPKDIILEVGKADEEGIYVFVKSPFLHSWFKARSIGEPQLVPDWNTSIFKLQRLPTILEATFASPGTPIMGDGMVNLTFLRSVNLNEGIRLVEALPPSEPSMSLIYNSVKRGMIDLWRDHIRQVTMKGIISFREDLPEAG
jgi:hypothetical protein